MYVTTPYFTLIWTGDGNYCHDIDRAVILAFCLVVLSLGLLTLLPLLLLCSDKETLLSPSPSSMSRASASCGQSGLCWGRWGKWGELRVLGGKWGGKRGLCWIWGMSHANLQCRFHHEMVDPKGALIPLRSGCWERSPSFLCQPTSLQKHGNPLRKLWCYSDA